MRKIVNFLDFIGESISTSNIPSYKDCLNLCSYEGSPFYEAKLFYDGYNISIFNYRLAQYKDFSNPPIDGVDGYEMRGLTFVFNTDGTVYNRYVLLEKFFNLNQVPESMYSIVKDYKIKYVNNKEDGSIASFIKLPNGEVIGRSKMGLDNDQANGINKIYNTNADIKRFVDWCLNNNIVPIFEYVAPHNKIVLRYSSEELILLRLRNNITGDHVDIKEHIDKIGSIKIAPFEDDHTLDGLIELSKTAEDREGWIVRFDNGKMVKVKTQWYMDRHGLLTEDIYHENIIIGYVLDDKIDDMLGQIPEDQNEVHDRINKIVSIVREALNDKTKQINDAYQVFVDMGKDKKLYASKYLKTPNFAHVMQVDKGYDPFDIAKDWLRDRTKRLMIAREWLATKGLVK